VEDLAIVIVYARGSFLSLLNAQNLHRFTQMFVGSHAG